MSNRQSWAQVIILAGTGLYFAANLLSGNTPLEIPPVTMLGALCRYIANADLADFQPMKANFGILPELPQAEKGKRERAAMHTARSLATLKDMIRHFIQQGSNG